MTRLPGQTPLNISERGSLNRRKESYTRHSMDYVDNNVNNLYAKVYPFALALRLRVLQIVCGISGIVMGTVAMIDERGKMNFGVSMPAGLMTTIAAGVSIHTSRGFGGYVQPNGNGEVISSLRFLGPSVGSALSLAALWGISLLLHLLLIWNSLDCWLLHSKEVTALSAILMTLTLLTLATTAVLLRIDCVYDPD